MNDFVDLFEDAELEGAMETWLASESDKGEIFTKPEVVSFMLSTIGLSGNLINKEVSVLEPSCGHGEFVAAIVESLASEIDALGEAPPVHQLTEKLLAYDLSEENVQETKGKVARLLERHYSRDDAALLSDHWIVCADYLLSDIERSFSHIIGNPPYIRVENIPREILSAYRRRFKTMSDRADIYVAFYEKSLSLLEQGGQLSFICTDRWVKNQYGRKLRELICNNFSLDMYVDLYGKDSFQRKVLTYPAITLISRKERSPAVVLHGPTLSDDLALSVKKSLESKLPYSEEISVRADVVKGSNPWLLGSLEEIELVRKLEENFPTLEEEGCKVYIGAATGNNKVFIVNEDLDIEQSRKIPVISSKETRSGELINSGKCIINTYDESGVINLSAYPKLKKYLESNRHQLERRHVAKLSPKNWFKTIDRVYPERAYSEKLMIPDIKSELTVIYDEGRYHPNNSIYYICSEEWDLIALKAVLESGIGRLFINTYSTKVASGFLRFQAQHLRRIRVPKWSELSTEVKRNLITAGSDNNIVLGRETVAAAYGLSKSELQLIGN